MGRVSISAKAARAIEDYLQWSRNREVEPSFSLHEAVPLQAWAELQRALLPKERRAWTPAVAAAADLRRQSRPTKAQKRRPNSWQGIVDSLRESSKAQKRLETDVIYATCLARAAGHCECGCGGVLDAVPAGWAWSTRPMGVPEMDHFASRRVPQTVQNCWILRADCHREKTRNHPDAAAWLRRFMAHCDQRIIAGEASYCEAANAASRRLVFVMTRSALPAAPRIR